MTIYPLVVPGHPSREEQLANTEPVYPPREAPLTNDELSKIRAKAQNPDSHSARLAQQIADALARRTAAKKSK